MISDETPLLPDVVRAYPFSWDSGFVWPPETEERENLAYARAVLEACLPRTVLASPEPPEEPAVWEREDDEYPEWTGIRAVLRGHMPYARHVTAGRMAGAGAECARLGVGTTDFEEIWTRRITAWIAEQTVIWCGLVVDDEKALTPRPPVPAVLPPVRTAGFSAGRSGAGVRSPASRIPAHLARPAPAHAACAAAPGTIPPPGSPARTAYGPASVPPRP